MDEGVEMMSGGEELGGGQVYEHRSGYEEELGNVRARRT